MSPDPTAQFAALGVEPTFSAREAAALLGRSFSWLDQGVRGGQFVMPDGTVVEPLRTPGRTGASRGRLQRKRRRTATGRIWRGYPQQRIAAGRCLRPATRRPRATPGIRRDRAA